VIDLTQLSRSDLYKHRSSTCDPFEALHVELYKQKVLYGHNTEFLFYNHGYYNKIMPVIGSNVKILKKDAVKAVQSVKAAPVKKVSPKKAKKAKPAPKANPWQAHIKQFRSDHPELSFKEVLVAASKTYKK